VILFLPVPSGCVLCGIQSIPLGHTQESMRFRTNADQCHDVASETPPTRSPIAIRPTIAGPDLALAIKAQR
jgi:hypothetical protein